MAKGLIIKGADFSNINVHLSEGVPERDTIITEKTVEKTGYIFEPNKVAVDTSLSNSSYISIGYYNISSVDIIYPGAYYSLVTNTNFGAGRAGKYDGYNIFAIVVGSEDKVLGVIPAHQKDGSNISNDTFYIDVSQYDNPAQIWFAHNSDRDVTVTALAGEPPVSE